jgi:hypothetical protein
VASSISTELLVHTLLFNSALISNSVNVFVATRSSGPKGRVIWASHPLLSFVQILKSAYSPPQGIKRSFQQEPTEELLNAWSVHGAILMAIEMCTGIAQRVDWAKIRWPLRFSILPFQGGNRLAILLTTDCIADLGKHQGESGTRNKCMENRRTGSPVCAWLNPTDP